MPYILVTVATNRVEQVADATFEVHPTLAWHSVENAEVKNGWQFNPDDNTVTDPSVQWLASPDGPRATMVRNRQKAYGPIGEQLDIIFRDMRDGTTVYVDHITAVKAKYPWVASTDSHAIALRAKGGTT